MKTDFEVIIIGGSYSGLSAAMALGRSLRNVLVIDSGQPCNAQSPHSHNFITQDGETPAAIAAKAREQILRYPIVQFKNDKVTNTEKAGDSFIITTENGETFTTRKLLLAAGVRDIFHDIKGLAQCWGITVVHCPYCHGYEARGQKTAILANGDAAMHYAQLLLQLTDKLEIFTNGPAEFSAEQKLKLQKHNIAITEIPVKEILHNEGKLYALVLEDGTTHDFEAVYYRAAFKQHSGAAAQLECTLDEFGIITVDAMQKTSVPGVFAAGDCCSMMRAVANAVAAGNKAGAMINFELAAESF